MKRKLEIEKVEIPKDEEKSKPNVDRPPGSKDKIEEPLLNHPFRFGIVAPTRGGKTNLIVNLLMRKEFYFKYFDRIFIWTPTWYDDDSWRVVDIPKEQVFTEYKTQDVQTVADKIAKSTQFRTLLIFDDCISEGLFSTNRESIISKLVFRGRHWNISMWFVSQSYKAITRGFRVNMQGWVFFRPGNKEEILKIFEEHGGFLSKQEFLDKFNYATQEDYSFLFINYQADLRNGSLYKKFEEAISSETNKKELSIE